MQSRQGYDMGRAFKQSAAVVGLVFLVTLGNFWLAGARLNAYGILPRRESGLAGILFSPLLHGSYTHLLANALPLFVLLALLFSDRRYFPWSTLVVIWLAAGFGTWLIGRGQAVHIGASAVIYGLVAYLVVAGFFMKSWRAVLITIVVLFFYGGLFFGLLPHNGPVSWEGHLCGAVAGVLVALLHHR